jgi:hypothetical protein
MEPPVLRLNSAVRGRQAAAVRQSGCRFPQAGIFVALALLLSPVFPAGRAAEAVPDLSGEYQFLAPEDTLAILEEEGKLKGYIDVYEGEQESDTVLSYQITIGSRQGNHVEFTTSKIHEKYFRFSGSVERGDGRAETGPDYLRLVGNLEIVTLDPESGEERTEQRQVVFKSEGKSEADK